MLRAASGWTVTAVDRGGLAQFKITDPAGRDAVPYGSKMTFLTDKAVAVFLATKGVALTDLQEVA